MNKILKSISIFVLTLGLMNTSCRKSEFEEIGAPLEKSLAANSNVADLLRRTAMNDGSDDNIIDNASCFTIELPVTIEVNGLEIIVDSEEDFDTIETIFDEFDDDNDLLEIFFPVTIVLNDFTQVVVANLNELEDFSNDCSGENETDDDIECVDVQYPITASVFNSNNEIIDTITISNDLELHNFIHDLNEDDIVNVNFPIVVILSDGSEVEVSNLIELETIIDNAKNDCDEDDDNDFNDDDCDNCTTNQLSNTLIGCSDWIVDKLEEFRIK